jgi:hypothetical protein
MRSISIGGMTASGEKSGKSWPNKQLGFLINVKHLAIPGSRLRKQNS